MSSLDERRMREIKRSRIVVLPTTRSYIDVITIPVRDITDKVAPGVMDANLQALYPDLNYDDARAGILSTYEQSEKYEIPYLTQAHFPTIKDHETNPINGGM